MNLEVIKKNLSKKLGHKVSITVKGLRNHKQIYEGVIYKMYPNLFSILSNNNEKCFSFADIATKEILIKYI